jgi:pimeloyl-ACP methyl ester carboxylesterase
VTLPAGATVRLRHNKVELALHQLRRGEGLPLLCLHGLGERTPAAASPELDPWPGPVWGLDFTGHGASTVPVGGGYTCELLMADADVALAHLGPAALYGRGLGAWVALLLAGARASEVRGAILADGPGLAGGGTRPGALSVIAVDPEDLAAAPPDPFALAELSRDVRPIDYAQGFAREAVRGSALDVPLFVTAYARPDWLRAVVEEIGVETATLPVALARLAA